MELSRRLERQPFFVLLCACALSSCTRVHHRKGGQGGVRGNTERRDWEELQGEGRRKKMEEETVDGVCFAGVKVYLPEQTLDNSRRRAK